MISKKLIVLFGVLALTACASQAPLDDAYYWPDKSASSAPSSSSSSSSASSASSATSPSTPPMEIINRQDTTITIRIKR
ncbi:MAG: hypothetical protein IKM83_04850 [Paludibacteraceae bacterium]|nr:hypothetical protein [Paludibacteraceae bacterium]